MKKLLLIITVLLLLNVFPYEVCAASENDKESISFDSIYEAIPDGLDKYVKDGIDLEALFHDSFENGLKYSIHTFSSVMMLAVITVFIQSICDARSGDDTVLSFITSSVCAITVFGIIYSQTEVVSVYSQRMLKFMNGFSLFSNSVLLFCGYISTAATSSAWLQIIMNFAQNVIFKYLMPILKILCGLSLADCTQIFGKISGLGGMIKGIFLWICGIVTTFLSIVMSVQTSLSKVSDTAGVQSIKFAATQAFPIVNGFVSESIRSVAGTANAAKSAGGSIALAVIAIIALFPLTSLLGVKIGLSLAQFASDLLDNHSISMVLSKANSLINFMLASIGLSASVFAICAASFISQSVSLAL